MIRLLPFDRMPQHEAPSAEYDDVGAAVGELLVDPYFGGTSDRTDRRNLLGPARRHDPEAPIRRETVGQHLPIPGLEDVQRQGGAGKEYDGKWKDGKAKSHVLQCSETGRKGVSGKEKA